MRADQFADARMRPPSCKAWRVLCVRHKTHDADSNYLKQRRFPFGMCERQYGRYVLDTMP